MYMYVRLRLTYNKILLCRHGRTETIRPATSAAKTCAELMQRSHSAGASEMMEAVRDATNTHFDLTRRAAMGQWVWVWVGVGVWGCGCVCVCVCVDSSIVLT